MAYNGPGGFGNYNYPYPYDQGYYYTHHDPNQNQYSAAQQTFAPQYTVGGHNPQSQYSAHFSYAPANQTGFIGAYPAYQMQPILDPNSQTHYGYYDPNQAYTNAYMEQQQWNPYAVQNPNYYPNYQVDPNQYPIMGVNAAQNIPQPQQQQPQYYTQQLNTQGHVSQNQVQTLQQPNTPTLPVTPSGQMSPSSPPTGSLSTLSLSTVVTTPTPSPTSQQSPAASLGSSSGTTSSGSTEGSSVSSGTPSLQGTSVSSGTSSLQGTSVSSGTPSLQGTSVSSGTPSSQGTRRRRRNDSELSREDWERPPPVRTPGGEIEVPIFQCTDDTPFESQLYQNSRTRNVKEEDMRDTARYLRWFGQFTKEIEPRHKKREKEWSASDVSQIKAPIKSDWEYYNASPLKIRNARRNRPYAVNVRDYPTKEFAESRKEGKVERFMDEASRRAAPSTRHSIGAQPARRASLRGYLDSDEDDDIFLPNDTREIYPQQAPEGVNVPILKY